MLVQKPLDQCVAFARNTTRWVMGANKRFSQVPINVPAMQYDGITGAPLGYSAERSATNFIWPSQVAPITSNQYHDATEVQSMFGTAQKAYKFVSKGAGRPPMTPSGGGFVIGSTTNPSPSTTPYIGQHIVELVPGDTLNVTIDLTWYRQQPTPGILGGVSFNTQTKAFTPQGTSGTGPGFGAFRMVDVGPNGGEVWCLWCAMILPPDTQLGLYPYITSNQAGASIISHYLGMESPNDRQLTSPIITTTAQVTRNTDYLGSMDLKKFAYNPLESTVACEFIQPIWPSVTRTLWEFGDNTLNNRFFIAGLNDGRVGIVGVVGGLPFTISGSTQSPVIQPGTRVQTAVSVKGTDCRLAVNGVVYTSTIRGIPVVDRVAIGGINLNGSNSIGAPIALFDYIPQAKDNATLIALTTKA